MRARRMGPAPERRATHGVSFVLLLGPCNAHDARAICLQRCGAAAPPRRPLARELRVWRSLSPMKRRLGIEGSNKRASSRSLPARVRYCSIARLLRTRLSRLDLEET